MIFSKQTIKEFNTTEIFNLIHEKMPISRARIAQITGLSPTTVSTLTQNMIDYGIVIETGVGRPASSGRRPVMIEVNPAGACVAAMEVTQEALTCALFDATCREMIRQDRSIADHNELGPLIRDALAELIRAAGIPQDKFRGLSVGIPAILDPETKRIVSSTILPVDPGVDFLEPVKQAYPGRFISAGNESSFAAYAEWKIGRRGYPLNLVYIDVNIGIGAGIIIDGEIYTGSAGSAGEIGHMTIDAGGPPCKCGAKGCLEIAASIPAALRKMKRAVISGEDPLVSGMIGGNLERLTADMLFRAYALGDPPVVRIVEEIAGHLAAGINSIVNLLDPQCVVVGGEITRLGSGFLDSLRERYGRIRIRASGPPILYASIAGNRVIVGGAAWILNKIVSNIGSIVHQ